MLSHTSYNPPKIGLYDQRTHRSLCPKPHSSYNDQTRPAVISVTSQPNGGAVTALLLKLTCFRTRLIPKQIGLYYQRTHRSLWQKPHSSYNDQTRLAVTSVTSQPNGGAVTALLLKQTCFCTRLKTKSTRVLGQKTHRSLGQKTHRSLGQKTHRSLWQKHTGL